MLSKEEYLDNLLKGVIEQDNELNKAKTPVEEPEVELSVEPETDEVLDADLVVLLESVPEMAVDEEIELPVEEPEQEAASDLMEEEPEPEPEVASDLMVEESMPELTIEPETEPFFEPETDVVLDADLAALLESAPEMAMEEEIELPVEEPEQEAASDLMEEEPEPEPEAASDLIVEESMPELMFEPETESSSEPETDVVLDADLAALLESVPEMAVEEEIELPVEEPEQEPSFEPETDEVLDADLAALLESVPEMAVDEEIELPVEEPVQEAASDLIEEEAMPELTMEEPEPELSVEPETDEVLDADLAALLESVPEMAVDEEIELPVEEPVQEAASDLIEEEAMPELTMEEEPEPELSVEPETDEVLDADLVALLESVPEMAVEEEAEPEQDALSDADLDALLESVPEMTEEEPEPEPADNLDSYSDIGDDIEARLDMAAELPPVTEEFPDDDVMSMLEESDDSDLQEIQELLRKSDSNEAVDSSVEDLLKELPEEDLEEKIFGDSEKPAEETPAEKRRKAKEEKAREKAEKKAEAAARKAAKKAEKEAAKRKKAATGRGQTQDKEEEPAFDPAVLDSIVSEAGMAGKVRQDDELPTDILGDMTEGGEEEPFNPLAEADEMPESPQPTEEMEAEESDGLGVDFDNLFGSEEALMGEEGVSLSALGSDQNASDDREKGEKKKGFFTRIIDFLTEEDEEEEGNENIQLSQENQDILNELDKEKGKKKKGKKGKKGKVSAEDEEASGKGAKGKKAAKPKKESKPKKPPKPKKEKPPKETPLIPERKLTFKRMLPVLLVGVSVGVLLFVFVNATVDFTDKKTARDAFYAGDYQTCYQNLFGKELDETESIMFGKSKSILYIRLWTREYQMFAEEGDRVRGLDSLIQTVAAYPELYEYAQQWNAEEEVAAGYATILNLLKSEYGLSESQALEISKIWRDVDYTRAVIAAAGGNFDSKAPDKDATVSGNDQGEIVNSGESQLPDFLPEEEGLGEENFHDNR